MNVRSWLAASWVSLGLAAFACGDGSDEGGSKEEGPALSALPALLAGALCEAYAGCMPPELVAVYLGTASCDTFLEKQVHNGLIEAAQAGVEAGTVEYHPSKVAACVDAIRDGGCASNHYYPECEAALKGTVAEGGDCRQDAECVGDLFCEVDGLCPGACAAKRAAGETCQRDAECGEGAVCFESQCVVQPGPGDDCEDGGIDCEGGSFCLGTDAQAGTPGQCELGADIFTAGVGAECDPATSLCVPGAACAISVEGVAVSWTCTEHVESGATCQLAFPDQCPTGEYCAETDPAQLDFEGVCTELPVDGEPCAGERCAVEHSCVEGTCRKRQVNESPCSDDDECYSKSCEGGSCVPDTACAL